MKRILITKRISVKNLHKVNMEKIVLPANVRFVKKIAVAKRITDEKMKDNFILFDFTETKIADNSNFDYSHFKSVKIYKKRAFTENFSLDPAKYITVLSPKYLGVPLIRSGGLQINTEVEEKPVKSNNTGRVSAHYVSKSLLKHRGTLSLCILF